MDFYRTTHSSVDAISPRIAPPLHTGHTTHTSNAPHASRAPHGSLAPTTGSRCLASTLSLASTTRSHAHTAPTMRHASSTRRPPSRIHSLADRTNPRHTKTHTQRRPEEAPDIPKAQLPVPHNHQLPHLVPSPTLQDETRHEVAGPNLDTTPCTQLGPH